MGHRDFYNILGVTRNASPDDIKRSYRALARKFHPDLNPGREDLAQRFKDITAAYETLSDPERRSRYDRLGPLYTEDGRPPRGEDLQEVVGTMFGNLFRRRRQDRGNDLRYTVSLTLEEVAVGVERAVIVPRRVRCEDCGGAGYAGPEGRESCGPCKGTGRSTGPRLFRTTCYHCEGRGFVVSKSCERCGGEGRHSRNDTIKVRVPAGVATGQKLKLAARGDDTRDGDSGDLFVIVNVAEHPLFRRRADDILVDLPLTYAEVALGADVEVPTLEGTTTIRVPRGTPPGKVFRLAGRGLPKVGSSGRGDLHLHVVLEVPTELDERHRADLAAWAAHLEPERHPSRAAFDSALRERQK